jgi:hypothetical protein
MATATKKWTFDVDVQGWVPQTGGIEVLAFQSSLGNPPGCLSYTQEGKNQTGVDGWDLFGTWESIFGVPSGSSVTSIMSQGDGLDSKCDIFDHSLISVSGPLSLFGILTLVPGRSYSGVESSWVNQSPTQLNQSIPSVLQPSNSSVQFHLGAEVKTGDRITAKNRLLHDNVIITVTYQ